MSRGKRVDSNFVIPPVLLTAFAFGGLGLLVSLTNFLDWGASFSESNQLAIYLPFFIVGVVGFFFFIYAEHKFNRLKLKNVLLYLSIIIALFNVLAVSLLPNQITILEKTLTITPIRRTEYILCGFAFALIPYILFYFAPRKILSHHHLNIVLMLLLSFVLISILLSPIYDWNHFKNGEPIQSFFPYKNAFGLVLLLGIFLSTILRIRTKKWWWSLFIIPFYIFLIFSSAKIAFVAATVAILTLIIVRLVQVSKKSKDNLIITLLIVGFCVLISPLFIMGIIRSESGILALIREYFNKAIESARSTISSRSIIWDSTLKLLSSYRVIFGYGICSFGPVLNLLYSQVGPEGDRHISDSHNLVLETLGRGGIILLAIELFLYVYLIRAILKTYKKNHYLSVANLIMIGLTIIVGMFESTCIGLNLDFFFNLVIVIPIMSEYYLTVDKDEKAIRKDIVNNIDTIKNRQYKSKLFTLNKKRLLLEAKYIAYDLNSKIKL